MEFIFNGERPRYIVWENTTVENIFYRYDVQTLQFNGVTVWKNSSDFGFGINHKNFSHGGFGISGYKTASVSVSY